MSEQLLNPFLTKLLHLSNPFFIKETTFNEQSGEVHHMIDINRGTKFDCPICGKEGVNIHDRLHKAWRHMNIYEYRTYIHFATPRVNCPICGVHLIEVPWSRPNSKFTELNEYLILALSTHMPIVSVAHLIKEYDTKIWRTVQHYVDAQHSNTEWSSLTNLGIDETSSKKGHSYISTFVDVENATVVYATPGKDASTITSFVEEMPKHKADSEQIKEVTMDMSPAFISGVETNFPEASITFDKFHVIKHLNEAVDAVRKAEQKYNPLLKGTRYIWLKNPENLTDVQKEQLKTLSKENTLTGRAYRLKTTFQDIYKHIEDKESAEVAIKKWLTWAKRSKLEPFIKFSKMVKSHHDGILRYWDSKLTSAVVEALNYKVQEVKRRARGFKNVNNFITMTYLVCGGLDLECKMVYY